MHLTFVNLKRFEIPKALGGLCPIDDPCAWIRAVIEETAALGFGDRDDLVLVYLLPEGLMPPAIEARERAGAAQAFEIGCQGAHWEDVEPGGDFGAFTALLPAKAAKALGASWTILGHSEERRAKLQVIETYDPASAHEVGPNRRALEAVDALIQREVQHALQAGLNVLLCVGESETQRGEGTKQEVAARLQAVLEAQIGGAFTGAAPLIEGRKFAIGYEPIWAIGPGKVPPGPEYIEFAASLAKKAGQNALGIEPPVVYGGGLKLENAAMLGGLNNVNGGLVALTRFTGDIGFEVKDLAAIIDAYLEAAVERGRS